MSYPECRGSRAIVKDGDAAPLSNEAMSSQRHCMGFMLFKVYQTYWQWVVCLGLSFSVGFKTEFPKIQGAECGASGCT